MSRTVWISAALLSAVFLFTATAWDRFDQDYSEMGKETIHKTLSFSNPAGTKSLSVDNLDGSIHVTGYDGATVQLEIAKTIRAESKEDADLARKEVDLKISERNNRIELYVDGPFRCQNGARRTRRLHYQVNFDFQIRVPRKCDLELSTVNNGDIRVQGISGKFDIENVNGRIQMDDVAGFGRAHAINGGIKALFERNPMGNCAFDSLNGNIDVAFRPGLSADCWFKTFNGGAFTDFDLHPLPQPAAKQERRNGMFVYRSHGSYGGRIGEGGPQLKFNTLNGNIHVTAR